MNDDGILHVVEHIEAELQRLGRLVATLRRRVEAAHEADDPTTVAAPPVSKVVSSGPAPRTMTRPTSQSQRRFPMAIEDNDVHEDTVVRTATTGSSYGFVRERTHERAPDPVSASWKKRTLESEPAPDDVLDRKTR
jgi:hypothetical protein